MNMDFTSSRLLAVEYKNRRGNEDESTADKKEKNRGELKMRNTRK